MAEVVLSTGPSTGQIVTYENVDGLAGAYDPSSVETTAGKGPPVVQSWAERTHPWYHIWARDEDKMRASFIGTREILAKFLVPHRFEGDIGMAVATKLRRARLGYSIGLNSAYLDEIFGHIRTTPTHYSWGTLGGPDDKNIQSPPTGPTALRFWNDATGDGKSWKEFFGGKVLEWLLSSPGGIVIVDSNKPAGTRVTEAQAIRLGYRSSLRFVPWSQVEDLGFGPRGLRWVKVAETVDEREADDKEDKGFTSFHLIYRLMEDGRTRIRRVDNKGNTIGEDVFQEVRDMDDKGMLPIQVAIFGEHPEVYFLGSGLLLGLDDIVIDLFNLLTETREAYRDAVFNFLAYRGTDAEGVLRQLQEGSRFIHIGQGNTEQLDVKGGEGGEVDAGLKLIDMGVQNWSLSATRRAIEAVKGQTGNAQSGNALKAEFQLDLAPVMVNIVERLDTIETGVMFILAQIEGKTPQEADILKVQREKEFQMEEEASRISRIVEEFKKSIPMPAVLIKQMILRWANSLSFLDMDAKLKEYNGQSLKDVLDTQATDIAEADQAAKMAQAQFATLGVAAAAGRTLGGNNGGGGAPPNSNPQNLNNNNRQAQRNNSNRTRQPRRPPTSQNGG